MEDSPNRINSLHPELLVQIFLLVLDDSTSTPRVDVFQPFSLDLHDFDKPSRRGRLKKIITLSNVCVYWRRVALNTGAFWTYVPIILTSHSIQHSLAKTSVWLDRAQTTPLDVFIDTGNSTNTQFRKLSQSTLDDTLPETPFSGKQIRTLSLTLWKTTCFNALLDKWFSPGVSSTLTKLRIRLINGIHDPSALQSWLSQCQKLQVLRLNIAPLCDAHFPLLPKLLDLELTAFATPLTTLEFANMLRGCPNLRRLTLDSIDIQATAGFDMTPVPLQYLGVLVLKELDISHVLPMISSKSHSLSLTITSASLYETSGDLIDYIKELSRLCSITALRLNVADIESRDIRRLLISLPQLQTLSLVDIYLDNPTALALRGASEFRVGKETTPPAFPIPYAIWLVQSVIDTEAALRSLVSVRPLQQLKLEHCSLASSRHGPILEAKELYKLLLDSVPDLTIIDGYY
ncbi:hypothetical protein BDV93DRAFT_604883 [Ceratobasidium sp. AG-I]|nr:hypothetical protein BDV93DRAFT_604883 [Ceratobasidium sp. AG-I]